ncbi:hypothetical protein H7F33_16940 [Pedobacter sp. PAMC26386]|nr:hypothetical protein H7F33_16940 [Pedobacter sp. PAMC26386]
MDNKILIIGLIFTMLGCKTKYINDKRRTMNEAFEKFDIEEYRNKNLRAKSDEHPNDFMTKGGTRIIRVGSEQTGYYEEQILPMPSFCKIQKEFYISGSIREKGLMFGNASVGENTLKIGKWYYFTEQGTLDKVVDEDKKFGKFSYDQLLDLIDKEGLISIHSGKNRENFHADFEINVSGKKLWKVKVNTEYLADVYTKGWNYQIDGNTGEIITKSKFTDTYN